MPVSARRRAKAATSAGGNSDISPCARRRPGRHADSFRQFQHLVNIHRLRRIADIEMDVEVDIVFAGQRKDALDLAGLIVS